MHVPSRSCEEGSGSLACIQAPADREVAERPRVARPAPFCVCRASMLRRVKLASVTAFLCRYGAIAHAKRDALREHGPTL
eukprot:scaffold16517_cov113-Isochrysis_galbana.AAC.4